MLVLLVLGAKVREKETYEKGLVADKGDHELPDMIGLRLTYPSHDSR